MYYGRMDDRFAQIRRSEQKKASKMIDWYRQKIALTKMVDNEEGEKKVLAVDEEERNQ